MRLFGRRGTGYRLSNARGAIATERDAPRAGRVAMLVVTWGGALRKGKKRGGEDPNCIAPRLPLAPYSTSAFTPRSRPLSELANQRAERARHTRRYSLYPQQTCRCLRRRRGALADLTR